MHKSGIDFTKRFGYNNNLSQKIGVCGACPNA